MLVSGIKEEDLTLEVIDRLLFQGLEDTGEDADCIIALGSIKASKYRVPVAAEIYHAGRAKKIMLCGGTIRDFATGKCSEAEHMRKTALELGVAEEDVILEAKSCNTVENIQYGLVKLQQALDLDSVCKVLLVTTAYHMRRSFAIARSLFPEHILIIPCPADDNNTRRDNWMNTPAGIERAKGEAKNIVRHVINGVIPDFEI